MQLRKLSTFNIMTDLVCRSKVHAPALKPNTSDKYSAFIKPDVFEVVTVHVYKFLLLGYLLLIVENP